MLIMVGFIVAIESTKIGQFNSRMDCTKEKFQDEDKLDNQAASEHCIKCCRGTLQAGFIYFTNNVRECKCEEAQGAAKCSLIKVPRQIVGKPKEAKDCEDCCSELEMSSSIGLTSRRCKCE